MTRPTVPEADRLVGVRRPVLSHGFVALVDYMGDDAAIVQAARVSYGKGTKSVRDDRGLIRYLMRHRHTTPFEMVEYKFLVRLPIYVARQWVRHRTACLAGETRLFFDLPSGAGGWKRRVYALSAAELWKRFQPTRNRAARKQRNPFYRRDRIQSMHLRQLDEDTLAFRHTQIVDVVASGVKPIFRMSLDDGKSIECTADHRFLFADGWATLADRTGLHEEGGRAVWSSGDFYVNVNGTEVLLPALYQDRAWLQLEYIGRQRSIRDIAEACGVVPETIIGWLNRFGIPRRETPSHLFLQGNQFRRLRRVRNGVPQPRRSRTPEERRYADREWLYTRWVTEGLSAGQIAALSGASLAVVRKWLRIHELTNHPSHDSNRRFEPGHVPWNLGKTYRLGPRPMTAARMRVLRSSRAGSASNFWKGGMSSEREGIGRWTTQIARSIHERHHWTCQLCLQRRTTLHAHHIIPVWADLSRARDPSNLTTLCDECHREVHRDERAYAERLGGAPAEAEWVRKPRVAWNKLTTSRLVRVREFSFLGPKPTYDVSVEGPHHNFVANGIVTHNSVNEYSARYSVIPDEFEVPAAEEVRHQSGRNRQGRGETLPAEVVDRFRNDLQSGATRAYTAYTHALEQGVARETARLLLPVAFYTQWYWKVNLQNLFHFLSLRLDAHAQEEIRLYAAEIAKLARVVCPVAFEAFEDFQVQGLTLGRRERKALRSLLEGKTPQEACAAAGLPLTREDGRPMTTGEGVEFLEKLDRIRTVD